MLTLANAILDQLAIKKQGHLSFCTISFSWKHTPLGSEPAMWIDFFYNDWSTVLSVSKYQRTHIYTREFIIFIFIRDSLKERERKKENSKMLFYAKTIIHIKLICGKTVSFYLFNKWLQMWTWFLPLFLSSSFLADLLLSKILALPRYADQVALDFREIPFTLKSNKATRT